jgi:hypothetical protein
MLTDNEVLKQRRTNATNKRAAHLSSEAVYSVQMCLSMPCMEQIPGERKPVITCAIERECSHIVVDCGNKQ